VARVDQVARALHWELLEEFRQHYPDFLLEDELFAQAGRDVMTGVSYQRKKPISG